MSEHDTMPLVAVRPAVAEDIDTLFRWANDPVVRRASFSSQAIDLAEHARWLVHVLEDPAQSLFIGEDSAGNAVGQIRFARDGDHAEVSISVAPESRNLGYGSDLLRAGIAAVLSDQPHLVVRAHLKPDNAPSRRLFESAGFRRAEDEVFKGNPSVVYVYNEGVSRRR